MNTHIHTYQQKNVKKCYKNNNKNINVTTKNNNHKTKQKYSYNKYKKNVNIYLSVNTSTWTPILTHSLTPTQNKFKIHKARKLLNILCKKKTKILRMIKVFWCCCLYFFSISMELCLYVFKCVCVFVSICMCLPVFVQK